VEGCRSRTRGFGERDHSEADPGLAEQVDSRLDRMRRLPWWRSRASRNLADDMTHAALTPLLGREFDNFLFASVGDDLNGHLLSVVSALAWLDVDPWKEAANLARMPRDRAMERLTSLIASVPKGPTTSLSSDVIAARLIALLPQAGGFDTAAARSVLQTVPTRRSRPYVGLGVLALLLVVYVKFAARDSILPEGLTGAPATTNETVH
jgi:hypothetical protein